MRCCARGPAGGEEEGCGGTSGAGARAAEWQNGMGPQLGQSPPPLSCCCPCSWAAQAAGGARMGWPCAAPCRGAQEASRTPEPRRLRPRRPRRAHAPFAHSKGSQGPRQGDQGAGRARGGVGRQMPPRLLAPAAPAAPSPSAYLADAAAAAAAGRRSRRYLGSESHTTQGLWGLLRGQGGTGRWDRREGCAVGGCRALAAALASHTGPGNGRGVGGCRGLWMRQIGCKLAGEASPS